MMDTIYSILGAVLPLEAYQYSFMKNALLAILLLTPVQTGRFEREAAMKSRTVRGISRSNCRCCGT